MKPAADPPAATAPRDPNAPDMRHVKPKGGARVRKQYGQQDVLEAGGEDVLWSSYWQRRQDEGEVSVGPAIADAAGTEK